ncbi:hypothetical protein [Glutamicibacter arilaitensis]|uniref:hypothetical protein n=1 Tax=Glutamicibacter arilaitensis TaxID=256701 RepID=UPI003F91DC39
MTSIGAVMKSAWQRLVAVVQDRPWIITLITFLLVIVHFLLVHFKIWADSWATLLASPDRGMAIYLGAASASAIVAGFAGVVVVFGLTATGEKFRNLRLDAGQSLGSNWTSSSVSGFSAAGVALMAAIATATGQFFWAPWLLEWSLLLLLHGTIRIIWLLRILMGIVAAQDAADAKKSKTVTLGENYFN